MKGEQVVYIHDGTFEGMLHAVAHAVKSQKNVRGIYAEEQYRPLLYDTVIHVQTERQQALRLFEYLKKLHDSAALYALHSYLSEYDNAGYHLYWMVKQSLVDGSKTIQCYSHDSIRYLDRLSQKVGREAHRFKGLIRFRILEDGLQYAPFEPDYNIIGYCADHFSKRLKDRRWILHDIRRNLALLWDTKKVQDIAINDHFNLHVQERGELPDSTLSAAEVHYQGLWKSFHESISNPGRHNQSLQRQRMPLRYWKYLVEME